MPTPDELRNFSPQEWRTYEARCWLIAYADLGLLFENLDRTEQMDVRAQLSRNAAIFASEKKERRDSKP